MKQQTTIKSGSNIQNKTEEGGKYKTTAPNSTENEQPDKARENLDPAEPDRAAEKDAAEEEEDMEARRAGKQKTLPTYRRKVTTHNKLATIDPPLRSSTPKESSSNLSSTFTRRKFETPQATTLITSPNATSTIQSTTVTAANISIAGNSSAAAANSSPRQRVPISFHGPVSTMGGAAAATSRVQKRLKQTGAAAAAAANTISTTSAAAPTTKSFTSAAKRPLKWPLTTGTTTTTTTMTTTTSASSKGQSGAAGIQKKASTTGSQSDKGEAVEGGDANKTRPNTYKAEKREIFDYPIIQSASPSKSKKSSDATDELTAHLDADPSGLLLLQRRRGINGGRGGPFFIDVHVTDAEAVMEDANTKVDMPVDLLPTPRVDDEVVAEKETEGEESFDEQLKMLNSRELEVKDLTVGKSNGGRGGRGRVAPVVKGSNDDESSPGATIRDLERKGDGKNKSFKFAVDLDFSGNKSKSLSLRKRDTSGKTA